MGSIYEVHPYAKLLPELSEAENFQMVESIRKHGQLIPILLFEGKIVDGRSRYNACREIGIEPQVLQWYPPEDTAEIIPAVMELNLARRHLTIQQRMAVAANAMEAMAGIKRKDPHPVTGKVPEVDSEFFGCTKAFAARTFGIDEKFVEMAGRIKAGMPELHKEMLAGTVTTDEAIKTFQSAEAKMQAKPAVACAPKAVRIPKLPNPFTSDRCLILIPGDRDNMVALSERLETDGFRHQIAVLDNGNWVTEMCKASGAN